VGATNYALLVYAAIFVISAQYFSRTDFARNALGIVAIATFLIHCYIMFVFQRAIDKFSTALLDLQDLLQRRGAGWLGVAAQATIIGPKWNLPWGRFSQCRLGPGWGWCRGWPVVAGLGLGLGAWGYYDDPYYSDACIVWNGYNWDNICY
jgi:hypothetical protein